MRVMGFLALVPRWAWGLLGGVAAVLVLLLLWRAEIRKAEARGYDRAMVAAAEAAAAASAAYQAQVDDAAASLATARADLRTKGRKVETDVARYYAANPDAAGVRCLPDERVRAANEARAGLYPAAPG